MLKWVKGVLPLFPAAALVFLLVDLVAIPAASEDAPPILPPAGEVLAGKAPYTFAVVGDSRGNENIYDAVIDGIKRDGAALILHGGDLVKRCDARQYRWLLHEMSEQDLRVPFCPVPGNHDVPDEPGADPKCAKMLYERSFGQPHYWFACGDTLFVGMDSSSERLPDGELEWLDHTLGLHRGQYRTCIVFTHTPPRNPQSPGDHDMGAEGDLMMAILEKWHVTLLLASHLHSYAEDRMRGIPVYITGGGGAELEHADDLYHYLLCRVDAEGNVTVQKKDVQAVPRHDYLEYVLRAKLGRQALRGLSAALLLIGLCYSWSAKRIGRRRRARLARKADADDPERAR